MEGLLAIAVLFLLMIIGVPIVWAFSCVLAILVFVYDISINTLLMQGYQSINSIVLLSLPLFILVGYLMNSGGTARAIVNFIDSLIGHRQGGMGSALIVSSGVFGAIAGTATAAVAAIGQIMSKPLQDRNYPKGYIAALLGMSSLLGILIPPSITMILFGVATKQSVTALFAATIGPGIILLIALVIVNKFSAKRIFKETIDKNITLSDCGGKKALNNFFRASGALMVPVLIGGGIYGGVFTPTEAAAVAVALSIILGFFVYKGLNFTVFYNSVIESVQATGTIVFILLFSFMIGRVLSFERVPQELVIFVSSLFNDPSLVLLLVSAFLVVAGMILDDVSVTVIVAPLLLPLMVEYGVHPIQFGAIVACSVVIGANSPPVAPVLYLSCRVSGAETHTSFLPATLLILLVGLPILLLVAFVPEVSLTLPRVLGLL